MFNNRGLPKKNKLFLNNILTKDVVFSVLILVIAITGFLVIISSGNNQLGSVLDQYYSSDLLTFRNLYNDLFNKNIEFNWRLSSQLFIFPDLMVYFISAFLTSTLHESIILNGIFNTVLIWLLAGLILRETKVKSPFLYSSLSIMLILFIIPFEGFENFKNIFSNSVYIGTLEISLLMILLLLRFLLNRQKKAMLILMFVSSLLSVITNPLFFVQSTIPILLFCQLLNYWKKLPKTDLLAIYLSLCSCALIAFLMRSLPPFSILLGRDVSSYFARDFHQFILSFWILLKEFWRTFPTLQTVINSLVCIYYIRSGKYILKEIRNHTTEISPKFLVLFLSIITAIVTIVVNAITGNAGVLRYYHHVFFYPVLFFWMFLPKGKYWIRCIKLIFIGIIIYNLLQFSRLDIISNWLDYYPQDVSCFDKSAREYNLSKGIGHYWNAKRTVFLSKTGLIVNSVTDNFTIDWSLNNLAEYKNFEPEFLITGYGITKEKAVEYFGDFDNEAVCGGFEILIYTSNPKFSKLFIPLIAPTRAAGIF